MNNKQIVASLNQIANELDSNGLYQEANVVTNVMVKISQSDLQYSGSSKYKPYANLSPQSVNVGNAAGSTAGSSTTDEQTFNQAIEHIKTLLNMGEKEGAKSIFFDTLEKLTEPAQREKFRNTYYELTAPSASPNAPVTKPNAPSTPIGTPKPSVPGKPSQPSSKPGMPSNPGSSKPSAPKSADGLDRWVNKAENIYSAWVTKGAKPGSSAFGLIKDVVDYMQNVKSRLPSSLHSSANAKIIKVQKMMQDIFDGMPDPTKTVGVMPYYGVSGVKGKSVNPFAEGDRLEGKKLDYQADYESKRY